MLMEIFMKGSGMTEKGMDMECSRNVMETILKAIGSMTAERDKARIFIAIKINFLLVNGSRINQKLEYIQK